MTTNPDIAELVERLRIESAKRKHAVQGEGPFAFDWKDKPHRLVYDAGRLANEAADALERQAAEIEDLKSLLKVSEDAKSAILEADWESYHD